MAETTEKISEIAFTPEKILNDAKKQLDEIESLVELLDGRVRKLVAERPMLALGGTLLAGYFAGRLLTRRGG